MHKNIIHILAAAILCCCWPALAADYAVVVHPSNTQKLAKTEIAKIFLIKTHTFPNDKKAVPLARSRNSKIMGAFSQEVLRKSLSRLRAYYLKLMFTGKGKAPREIATDAEVKKAIAADPQAIGIIKRDAVDGSVRVVYEF